MPVLLCQLDAFRQRLGEALVNVVRVIQFIDEDNLGRIAEGASAISLTCVFRIAIGAEVAAYRRAIVGFPRDDASGGHPAIGVAGDAVIVSSRNWPCSTAAK